MIILYFILIALGGYLYRLGGASHNEFPYLPKWLVKGYIRPLGITLLTLLMLTLLGKYHWSLWLCVPLLWLALNSYWGFITKLLGKPTSDNYWFNYLAHGIGVGLAIIPYGIYIHVLPMVFIRAVVMGLMIMVWSQSFDDVDIEEVGRGLIIMTTLFML